MKLYYPDRFKGKPVYRCLFCAYDSFDLGAIEQHCNSHPMPDLTVDASTLTIPNVKVAILFLTWNTREASYLAAEAINKEQAHLRAVGIESRVYWLDNGSTDGTWETLMPILPGNSWYLPTNVGISKARNYLINEALNYFPDYLVMIDGDIEPIYMSFFWMLIQLHHSSQKVGCFGLHSNNCTPVHDAFTSDIMGHVHLLQVEPSLIAWTQYGIFRSELFTKGLRFEEGGPFGEPGWGLEDSDFFLQMRKAGYSSEHTAWFRYLHRNRHGSIPMLGTMAAKNFKDRRQYLRDKWKSDYWSSEHVRLFTGSQLPDTL